ncbi:MAG TPA: LytR C-terminal domain-containing protein [Mycobacteriales bacterium]|nr:LytR C-terminal domain-containing protein [Mycobacteriales bacterium]
MTMLSPLGRVPKRRPPRRPRQGRRPQPALVMISLLVVAAIVVWWWVFHPSHGTEAAGCVPKPSPGLSKMDPRQVKVRVYNSTDRSGLATSVSKQLAARHFAIDATGNDPIRDQRDVRGLGEIRYGSAGAQQAVLLSFQLPGIKLVRDPRTDAVVDLAIGPTFSKLATPAQAAQAAKVAEANAKADAQFGGGSTC